MAKRPIFDESGDSEDLQALFDSIAVEPPAPVPKPRLEVVVEAQGDNDDLQALFDSVSLRAAKPVVAAPKPGPKTDTGGDSDDLQALFDSVAENFVAEHEEEPAAVPEHSCDAVFTRIGHMTRQLHDTMRELGYDRLLEDSAKAIPDARQRLNYIATKTEQAASRVLNATDIAKPIQDSMHDRSMLLSRRWDKMFANELSRDDFKRLAAETSAFLKDVPQQTAATNEQLMEIMMAQDFQDLTGQVIKKVVDLAQNLETQLLRVLVETIPEAKRHEAPEGLMNGPVINPEGRPDVVNTQEQVDDLLESLGF
ncbi:MAG: protein phosphatase CheZ [Rhodocyclaceae bacterium]|nr:protein phosphatase CheZ [Rhodocyclaceae bacterium]